jgi:hypothetical protein
VKGSAVSPLESYYCVAENLPIDWITFLGTSILPEW